MIRNIDVRTLCEGNHDIDSITKKCNNCSYVAGGLVSNYLQYLRENKSNESVTIESLKMPIEIIEKKLRDVDKLFE